MIRRRLALLLLTCAGLAFAGNVHAAGDAAFVWANQATAEHYKPSATYSYNPAGGAIEITRGDTGLYRVRFAGMNLAGGNVQVTAYGSASRLCQVDHWSGE